MKITFSLILFGLLIWANCFVSNLEACKYESKGNLVFPRNFTFGTSTSAYQIEGGWDADGKGLSIWDDFTHNYPHLIKDGSDGDIAIDSYNRFDDDLEMLKELGVNHYRFSLSWSRIFPNGEVKRKNQAGIDYYNKVIDKLIAHDITPFVTIYHFDTPLEIQKTGGFLSSMTIEYFVQYATAVFELFGDRVKHWITINEPTFLCKHAYAEGLYPPLVNAPGIADYICNDNMLKAHAAAYRVYKTRFYPKQRGQVGISFNTPYFIMENPSDKDLLERAMQFHLGHLAHPIFSKSGGYPPVMVKDIAKNSLEEGRIVSRLPSLEGEWKDIIKGSADFLGLNYYTSYRIGRASEPVGRNPSFERDVNYKLFKNPSTAQACVPAGLEGALLWIKKEYNNVPVIITENGYRDKGETNDESRTNYLKTHLQAVLNAVNQGCNVFGYTHWSLVDNFEWIYGYTARFGLYGVNFTSPTKEREPKQSAHFYKKVLSLRKFFNDDIL